MNNAAPYPCDASVACVSISAEIHQLAESLGNAIDAKDHFTSMHSEEVAIVSHILALAMGLTPYMADCIDIAGHLHDIGKIGIPDAVLKKPDKLTPEEWGKIKEHPTIGANIIRPVHFLSENGIVDMVLHHHERHDGRGYPNGLSGEYIPIGSRIIAVSDSLSAMMQDRPYRAGMSFEEAMEEININTGIRYHPEVVNALISRLSEVKEALNIIQITGGFRGGPA